LFLLLFFFCLGALPPACLSLVIPEDGGVAKGRQGAGGTVPGVTVEPSGGLAEAEWEAHRPAVFGAAYRILGTVAEAEDVTQEVWLRAAAADLSGGGDRRMMASGAEGKEVKMRINQFIYLSFRAGCPVLQGRGECPLPRSGAEEAESPPGRFGVSGATVSSPTSSRCSSSELRDRRSALA
jgi:hypothetical protein